MSDLSALSPGLNTGFGSPYGAAFGSACGDKSMYGGYGGNPGAYSASSLWAMNSFFHFLIWFIIIWIIVWVILWLIKPSWILAPSITGPVVDYGKLFLWSFIISLIVIILIWLLKSCSGSGNRGW